MNESWPVPSWAGRVYEPCLTYMEPSGPTPWKRRLSVRSRFPVG